MRSLKTLLSDTSGVGLIGTLIGLLLLSVLSWGFVQLMDTTFRSTKHFDLSQDLVALKRHITEALDCATTLASGYPNGSNVLSPVNTVAGPDCDTTSAAHKWLMLKDKNGNDLTQNLDLVAGPFRYTGKAGPWEVLTECDRVNHTLAVRVARKNGTSFVPDPLTKRTYDFTPDNSRYIFGGGGAERICQAQLGGPPSPASSCPPGSVVSSVDFTTKTVGCAPATSAGPNPTNCKMARNFNAGGPDCGGMPGCTVGPANFLFIDLPAGWYIKGISFNTSDYTDTVTACQF